VRLVPLYKMTLAYDGTAYQGWQVQPEVDTIQHRVQNALTRMAKSSVDVVAAGRGFISFGLGYATVPSVDKLGYDGAMNMYAVVCGVVSLIGVPAFFLGKRIRLWTRRHYWPVE
jgi:hypothetical protein